ncbi:hypothetical protein TNCV_2026411 [Trichonephila clavipes]|nr:hypothetical protein TNCV_2026411 [Trichonephila clavipes]
MWIPPQVLQAASKWRGGVPGRSGRCTSGVSTPGRATQGVKATPFCSAKACSFSSSLEHAASLVTQNNQGCAEGLGRGPSSKNLQRSPAKYRSLKIIHCNINGISTYASRIKLDAILDIAESLEVQIIALQETKLKEHAKLKIKGYNIIRSDRQEGGGGGLAFLVRDINYRTIDNPQFTDSKLEIQRLNVIWKGKNLNISNMYHPPNQKSMPDNLLDISESNLLVGDLNAKHSSWGSVINNKRGVELHNLMDDSAHLALNDGSPTYSSHSYHTEEALDVSIVSSDIFPFCKWTVLQDIESDHLPILVELKWKQMTQLVKKNFWNFKRPIGRSTETQLIVGCSQNLPLNVGLLMISMSPGFLSRKSSSRLLVKLYLGEITNGPLHFLCINLHCFNPC